MWSASSSSPLAILCQRWACIFPTPRSEKTGNFALPVLSGRPPFDFSMSGNSPARRSARWRSLPYRPVAMGSSALGLELDRPLTRLQGPSRNHSGLSYYLWTWSNSARTASAYPLNVRTSACDGAVWVGTEPLWYVDRTKDAT